MSERNSIKQEMSSAIIQLAPRICSFDRVCTKTEVRLALFPVDVVVRTREVASTRISDFERLAILNLTDNTLHIIVWYSAQYTEPISSRAVRL